MHRTPPFIIALLTAIAMAVLYLGFTDNVNWRELIASAIAGGLSALAAFIFARAGKIRYALRWRDIIQAWRIPWCVLSGTVEVMRGLARQLFSAAGAHSLVAAVRYDMGRKDDIADGGRRALEITYTTSTPNFIIFGLVDQQDLLLYHQVFPGEVREMSKKLGAQP